MTPQEAITYLNSMTPQAVNMILLDKMKWEEFKAVVIPLLTSPGVDAKYKTALEKIDVIINTTLI